MAEAAEKNPIEQRLDYLEGIWNAFVQNPNARLLRWVVDDDGVRLVELLIDLQNEEVGTIPDLFIRFDLPFTDPETYANGLLRSLKEQYEASRKDIESETLPADWTLPIPQADETPMQTLLAALASFADYYRSTTSTVAVFLDPSERQMPAQWSAFLAALLQHEIPATLRFTVIDHVDRPVLGTLGEQAPTLVMSAAPDLDLPGALEEIADGAEGVGPGNDFRKLFVRLGNLAAKGDVRATNKTAVAALRIARKHHWHDLQTAVYMVLGAMYTAKRDPLALKAYQYAHRAAAEAQKSGNPAGGKLVVQTRFAEAAVLVGDEKYAQAASLYEEIGPLAKGQDDAFLEMEAWRMASYCHEMENAPSDAWRCGQHALEAGERLDDELRANSTLPYVGQRLLGLLKENNADRKYERQVQERMVALVGENWQDKLATTEPATS